MKQESLLIETESDSENIEIEKCPYEKMADLLLGYIARNWSIQQIKAFVENLKVLSDVHQ
jgi:hypothetical protein